MSLLLAGKPMFLGIDRQLASPHGQEQVTQRHNEQRLPRQPMHQRRNNARSLGFHRFWQEMRELHLGGRRISPNGRKSTLQSRGLVD